MSIKKIILYFTIIIISYNLMLRFVKPNWIELGLFQGNLSKSQEYIDSDSIYHTVLVGSSKSYRLSSPSGVFNLALNAGSLFTGLELIKAKKKLPSQILIEVNVLGKDVDNKLLDKILFFKSAEIRNMIWSFKEKYRPFDLLAPILYYNLNFNLIYGKMEHLFWFCSFDEVRVRETLAETIKKENFKNQKINFHKVQIKKLSQYISYFKSKGVDIKLYLMPPECQYYKEFEIYKFNLVKIPSDCKLYNAPDGGHLDTESARKYSEYLFNNIN